MFRNSPLVNIAPILCTLVLVMILMSGCPTDSSTSSTQTPSSYTYFTKGLEYLTAAQYKLAIEEFSKAAELDPNDADIYTNRGWAYAKLGEYERAVADYRRSIALDPDLPV